MRQNVHGDNFSDCVTETPLIADTYDATANDSNKTFVVPNNEMWKINHAHIDFVSSAAVGNRIIQMDVINENGNVINSISAGVVQAASLERHYVFLQGIFRETAFVNGEVQVPIAADLYLPPGYSIKFYDVAAIAADADDMTVAFQYKRMII